jgi:hypothetical protein
MSRIESLLYSLESDARHKRYVLKTGKYGNEKLNMRERGLWGAALYQLEKDIQAIRFWFKYKKKVP